MIRNTAIPDAVRAEYGLAAAQLTPLGKGLINGTWLAREGDGRRVLQCLNPIFPAEVNIDIDVVTRHLAAHGFDICRLVPTAAGRLWTECDGRVWRLLTFVDGVSHDRLSSSHQAESAGALLVRFHRAMDGLEHTFTNPRLGIHDTVRHLAFLRDTLRAKADHPQHADIARLGRRIFAAAEALPAYPQTPDRIVHGDPKINNLMFSHATDRAFSLVDLDTLAWMPLPLELGDAFRSWCNPAGEDDRISEFSAALFSDSVRGYAQGARGWMTNDEAASLVAATERILVELAARFCADALNECYFGWNPDRFATRSEHNQARAASQLHVARSLAQQRDALDAIVRAAFPGA